MKKIIIAIDGYSACGKSTTARAVASQLGYTYIDSGAMYRAITYLLLKEGILFTDIDAINNVLEQVTISFKKDDMGYPVTCLNGEEVEKEIREKEVSDNVSAVAAISEVRRAMVKIQKKLGKERGIVMDGRDIGTVVFPGAELKIFMTAEKKIRAKRRMKEWEEKGFDASFEAVLRNVEERDHIDSTRDDSPLKQAEDAVVIDNSYLSFDEQVEKVIELANKRISE
jgi:cytidylate kinase